MEKGSVNARNGSKIIEMQGKENRKGKKTSVTCMHAKEYPDSVVQVLMF